MGRRYSNLVAIIAGSAISIFAGAAANAQPHGQQGGGGRPGPAQHRAPTINNPRDRFLALPPQDRQIFQKNAERWMQMGPEERMIMREREKIYRARVNREVDAALRDSGLRLDAERRAQFEQRYLQERRRIEHSLRQEVESKRQEQLPALQERLKKEFGTSPSSSSTIAPGTSASPKK